MPTESLDAKTVDAANNGCLHLFCGGGSGGRRRKQFNINDNSLADDAMLAADLNELSVQEREKVCEEVHGIIDLRNETPELINDSLEQLTVKLQKVPRSKRRAMDRAFFLRPGLETDPKFGLLFLRADNYDAEKAATRIAKYFQNKLELFGEAKLVKRITLDDMDEEDMETVQTGAVQILSLKDRAGRSVIFAAQQHYKYKRWQNQVCGKSEIYIIRKARVDAHLFGNSHDCLFFRYVIVGIKSWRPWKTKNVNSRASSMWPILWA
jgi:hypothetical protein